jgi:sporulation protein YlmC with PRC-barrel domain
MRRPAPLKLLSEVRDLQIVDSEGRNCGICDDIEFDGAPGGPLTVSALLVGPGAYAGRLPKWAHRLVVRIAGKRIVRVPWQSIEKISGRIYLSVNAETAGLRKTEDRLSKTLRQVPLS